MLKHGKYRLRIDKYLLFGVEFGFLILLQKFLELWKTSFGSVVSVDNCGGRDGNTTDDCLTDNLYCQLFFLDRRFR
jgi:hypothetical protein